MLLFFARAAQRHPLLPVSLGLVIGGRLEPIDRVRLGHVTDFLDFDYWPAFNLADTFIVVGVGSLRLASSPPTARALRWHRSAFALLSATWAHDSIVCSPNGRRSRRGRSPSA
jgi:hypothetical protein